MVAVEESHDSSEGKQDVGKVPNLESGNIKVSIRNLKFYMMGYNRAHLGLEPKEKAPVQKASVQSDKSNGAYKIMAAYEAKIELWETRRSKALALVYQASQADNDVALLMAMYVDECESKKEESTAVKFLEMCMERFNGQQDYNLAETKNKFETFVVVLAGPLRMALVLC